MFRNSLELTAEVADVAKVGMLVNTARDRSLPVHVAQRCLPFGRTCRMPPTLCCCVVCRHVEHAETNINNVQLPAKRFHKAPTIVID